eukprot:695597-Amphidinium_carterae.2
MKFCPGAFQELTLLAHQLSSSFSIELFRKVVLQRFEESVSRGWVFSFLKCAGLVRRSMRQGTCAISHTPDQVTRQVLSNADSLGVIAPLPQLKSDLLHLVAGVVPQTRARARHSL